MKKLTDGISEIRSTLTKNRAEHLGRDVWESFVVPRFFNKDTFVSDMPTRIEGGRGSGKTMILRYLSFQSQFSLNREVVPNGTEDRIGLYWRADTQFLRIMTKRTVTDEDWVRVFQHYLVVKISSELVTSIIQIGKSSSEAISLFEIENTIIKGLDVFGLEDGNIYDLKTQIDDLLAKTEVEIQNIRNVDSLTCLPHTFLNKLTDKIRHAYIALEQSTYCIYIDEYENLLPYQQRVINTYIKHSEPPLIFNVAIKVNGMSETLTLSEERLENRADFNIVNLESEIDGGEFKLYVAEIFLKKISQASPHLSKIIDLDFGALQEKHRTGERKKEDYEASISSKIDRIFPGRTHDDLANEVFNTPRYIKKLREEIKKALEFKNCTTFTPDTFILDDHKKASIVCSSLLFRSRIAPSEVAEELNKLKEGTENNFTGSRSWEHNNFVGCYLRIITSYKANSTFYSGFDVYAALSNGNVRHFLELARTAISQIDDISLTDGLTISNRSQDYAAKVTSEELYREISRFTPYGKQLKSLVAGLGGLFQEYGKRETQSEPEIIHFSLKANTSMPQDSDFKILSEAEKWGVLKSVASTKQKTLGSGVDFDYLFNPVYSPFFNITYRKGRKIELDIADFRGLYQNGSEYVKQLSKKLKLSDSPQETPNQQQGTLL